VKLRTAILLLIVLVLAVPAGLSSAQDSVELRIFWYNDGNEGDVLRDLLDRFEEEHPGITVEIDVVAYADLDAVLQPQVEAGGSEAPDMARVTNTARYRDFYLDMTPYLSDPAYWEASFADAVLDSFRRAGRDGIFGFPTQFTVTGPFINRTLFEQAGVDVPSDVMDEPTWADWEAAATEVAEITGVPYAIAIDRSGHRVWGPALSMGATFLNEDGSFTVDSPGFRAVADMIVGWHEKEITPLSVWIESGGGSYASARPEFVNGQLVMYMSGSWQLAGFASDIGDSFDWDAVPNPYGEGGSTGIPGGAVLAAMSSTEHPEEVTMVMEYLASEEILAEFTARTLFIPGHVGIAAAGVDYVTDDPNVMQALNTFLAEVPKLSEEAYGLQYSPIGGTLNVGIRDRLSQVIVGELTLDEAIERLQEEVDAAFAEASGG
jgi:alpha-1,4-digalacturonate transport system substrate-binding protein